VCVGSINVGELGVEEVEIRDFAVVMGVVFEVDIFVVDEDCVVE
jgi:hypothetical protein